LPRLNLSSQKWGMRSPSEMMGFFLI